MKFLLARIGLGANTSCVILVCFTWVLCVFVGSGPFLLDFHVGFHTPCSQLVVFYVGFDAFLIQNSQLLGGLEMLQMLVSEASWKPSLGRARKSFQIAFQKLPGSIFLAGPKKFKISPQKLPAQASLKMAPQSVPK